MTDPAGSGVGSVAAFDSDSEVAAMVYGPGDDPDTLLREFATRLLAQGCDVVGVLQSRNRLTPDQRGPAKFIMLPECEPGFPARAPEPGVCAESLRSINRHLSRALLNHPHLLLLNRYGSLEAAGHGLLPLFGEAIGHGIPLLTAVPIGLFGSFLAMSGGLAVKLSPDPVSLIRWWTRLRRGPVAASHPENFCATFK
jgi:hypothetical protein